MKKVTPFLTLSPYKLSPYKSPKPLHIFCLNFLRNLKRFRFSAQYETEIEMKVELNDHFFDF